MKGLLLRAGDVAGLRQKGLEAEGRGFDALFVGDSPQGDPVVLAAALSDAVRGPLLGVCTVVGAGGRHPAILARELTCLDLVHGGRTVLCFCPPFMDDLAAVIAMCRDLWRDGTASGRAGPFEVDGALNRPRPPDGTPLVALDLTNDPHLSDDLRRAADLLLRAGGAPGLYDIERP
jgi:alkanesulfonate monooxygenase SsuD/methylene tetrahydromethanopterin reductase-like flavin-dependent oxidoreductase (luciferase family)